MTNCGSFYQQTDHLDLAIGDFGEAIRLNPEAIEAYKHRGETLWKQGKRDAAIEDFRQALRLDSTDEDALRALRALDALPSDDKATTAR